MVEVADVRKLLDNISADLVPDDTIEMGILIAESLLGFFVSDEAPADLVERAKLLYAAYIAANSYAMSVETTEGVVPPELTRAISRLKEEFERVFEAIVPAGEIPVFYEECVEE